MDLLCFRNIFERSSYANRLDLLEKCFRTNQYLLSVVEITNIEDFVFFSGTENSDIIYNTPDNWVPFDFNLFDEYSYSIAYSTKYWGDNEKRDCYYNRKIKIEEKKIFEVVAEDATLSESRFFFKVEETGNSRRCMYIYVKGRNYLFSFFKKLVKCSYPANIEKFSSNTFSVRWSGAYDTGTTVTDNSFEDSLRWELSSKDREVAGDCLTSDSTDVAKSVNALLKQRNDRCNYCGVGFLYSASKIRKIYDSDVWSEQLGPFLVPSKTCYAEVNHGFEVKTILSRCPITLEYIVANFIPESRLMVEEIQKFCHEFGGMKVADIDTDDLHFFCDFNKKLRKESKILNTLHNYMNSKSTHVVEEQLDTLFAKLLKEVQFLYEATDVLDEIMSKTLVETLEEENFDGHYECFIKMGEIPEAIIVNPRRCRRSTIELVKRVAEDTRTDIIYL